MHIASRQDEEREISQVPPRHVYGGQMEHNSETRQTLHEILQSLQSPLHPGWLQRHYNG